MPGYAKIFRDMWADASFRDLPEDARTLWIYLLTGPHSTSFGLYLLDDGTAAGDLQWTVRRLNRAFDSLELANQVKKDQKNRLIFVVNLLKFSPPENRNVAVSWEKLLFALPVSPLLWEFSAAASQHLASDWGKELANGIANSLAIRFPNGYPERYGNTRKPSSPEAHKTIKTSSPLPPSGEPAAAAAASEKERQGTSDEKDPPEDREQIAAIFKAVDENWGPRALNQILTSKLNDFIDEFGAERVLYAVKEAALHGAHDKFAYAKKVLEDRGPPGNRGKDAPAWLTAN